MKEQKYIKPSLYERDDKEYEKAIVRIEGYSIVVSEDDMVNRMLPTLESEFTVTTIA